MRKVVAIIEIDDDRAIDLDIGTIDYLEQEFVWINNSGIFLNYARVIDDDDPDDQGAINLVDKLCRT